MMWLVRSVPLSLDGLEMKFTAYRIVSFMGRMEYLGTWYANTYDAAMNMIMNETGIDIGSLKIVGRMS
jgi:hypothetical protein